MVMCSLGTGVKGKDLTMLAARSEELSGVQEQAQHLAHWSGWDHKQRGDFADVFDGE